MDSDDIVVHYTLRGTYPEHDVGKDKKRAARKRAANLVVERGEVLLNFIIQCVVNWYQNY